MPITSIDFQDTPNPNAIKCVVDRPIADSPRSYFSKDQSAADPLAAGLFDIPGVTNVLILGNFVTVSKRPETTWKSLKPQIERVLRAAT